MIEKILENLENIKDFEKKGPNIEKPSEKMQNVKLNYESIYKGENGKEALTKNKETEKIE